jgi:hypothetical protein
MMIIQKASLIGSPFLFLYQMMPPKSNFYVFSFWDFGFSSDLKSLVSRRCSKSPRILLANMSPSGVEPG